MRTLSSAVSYTESRDALIPTRRHVTYCRCENNGYYSLIGNNGSSAFSMINETAKEIIELCDGKKTLGDILTCLCDEYPSVQVKTIRKDLFNSIDSLYGLRVIGIKNKADIEMNKLENIDSARSAWIADEEDLPTITDYIRRIEKRKTGIAYCWGENPERYYDSVNVRKKLFDFSSDYFLLKEMNALQDKAESRITALIELEYPADVLINSANINLAVGEVACFGSLLEAVIKYCQSCKYRQINTIRIRIPEADGAQIDELIHACLEAGFKREVIQKKEYGANSLNLSIYALSI